jgi:hypothetical protein
MPGIVTGIFTGYSAHTVWHYGWEYVVSIYILHGIILFSWITR